MLASTPLTKALLQAEVAKVPEEEIKAAGWLRVGNGYVGQPIECADGVTVMFWPARAEQPNQEPKAEPQLSLL